jgi:quercetin dioxygenase-like cupin family protein
LRIPDCGLKANAAALPAVQPSFRLPLRVPPIRDPPSENRNSTMPFARLASLPRRTVVPGVEGHYVHLARTTLGEVELAAGAIVPPHQHPHDQFSYVISGRVEFTVGSETSVMQAGDCALIPGGTAHGCHALEACRLVDVFAPVREEYR